MINRITTAADAINRSISNDETVVVANHSTLQIDLLAACIDWTEAGRDEDGDPIYEYWGKDEDNNEWRVHVLGASGH